MSTPVNPPPAVPGPRPVKSSEDYFNSSRLRVIGLITAATVAVGALGGIAGVAFDPDPVKRDNIEQPGGSGAGSLGSPGNSVPHAKVAPRAGASFTHRLPAADTTQSPSSVGSISPGGGGVSDDPSSGTSGGSGGSGGSDGSGGSGVVMDSTGVAVYVPPGWTVDHQTEDQVYESSGDGSFAFAFTGVADPSTAAGDLITQNLDSLLPPDTYTQRQTSDVVPLEAFGSVVSMAGIEYEALWVDNQGSVSIHGQLYLGVRQDGTVLGIEIERVPAEEFTDALDAMFPVVDLSFGAFGGLG